MILIFCFVCGYVLFKLYYKGFVVCCELFYEVYVVIEYFFIVIVVDLYDFVFGS